MSATTLITAEQFIRMPDDGFRNELIAGVIKKKPLRNWWSAVAVSRLQAALGHHVHEHKLGVTLPGCGFILSRNPDTVLAPAFAFLSAARFRAIEEKEEYCPGPPDLATEVVSIGESASELDEKAKAWLDAGARMAWVVDPDRRTFTVYRSSTDAKTLTEKDDLDGQDVVPGFRCRVSEVFEAI